MYRSTASLRLLKSFPIHLAKLGVCDRWPRGDIEIEQRRLETHQRASLAETKAVSHDTRFGAQLRRPQSARMQQREHSASARAISPAENSRSMVDSCLGSLTKLTTSSSRCRKHRRRVLTMQGSIRSPTYWSRSARPPVQRMASHGSSIPNRCMLGRGASSVVVSVFGLQSQDDFFAICIAHSEVHQRRFSPTWAKPGRSQNAWMDASDSIQSQSLKAAWL